MSKRIFSLVMTLLLVFSVVVPTMAAPLSDVEGTKYEEAVARLSALGILQGYEDGTFKADKTITRAEFAAVSMRALGLDATAKSSNGATAFSDVSGTHWASGYINLATSKGIIKGYPDGTFKPEKEVTYAESITMLVRLLGYEPSVQGNNWPSNFLVKAAEIGVTGNLNFDQSAPAPRGEVAILTNNSLEVDLMEQDTYGTDVEFVEKEGETLLTEYLNVHELEDAIVSVTPGYSQDTLDANEVEIIDENGKTYTFEVVEGIALDAVLGHEVTAFVQDGDNDGKVEDDELVLMLQSTTDEKDIIAWDWVVGIGQDKDGGYDLDVGGMDVSLDDTDDTFDFAENAVVYYNHERVTDLTDMASDQLGVGFAYLYEVAGSFILNEDDEVVFMNQFNYDDPVVVTEVEVDDEKITYFKDTENESSLNLDGETYTIYKNGKLATIEDVEVDDVLYIWELTDGSWAVEAYSGQVTGTLEAIYADSNMYWDYAVEVDGTRIYVGPNFTVSLDENDTIDLLGTPEAEVEAGALADLEDLVGQEVTVYLGKYQDATDGWNYGRHIVSSVDASESTYFMVTDDPWRVKGAGWEYYIELTDENDNDIVYELTEDATEFDGYELDLVTSVLGDVDGEEKIIQASSTDENPVLRTLGLTKGTLVDVEFNSDGTISAIDTFTAIDETVLNPADAINEDYDRIRVNGVWYYVTDETALFDANASTLEAIDWSSLEDIASGFVIKYAEFDDKEVEAIIVDGGGTAIGSSDYGLVLKRSVKADGLYVTLAVENDVFEMYAGDLSSSKQNDLKEGALTLFTSSDNELDSSSVINDVYRLFNVNLDSDGDGVTENYTKFEIVSGGVDAKNGVIEVVAYGLDEDVDPTYFLDVDQYGADSFFYDVDISHLADPASKILDLADLNDGDIIKAYDVDENGIFEYIVVVDR